jgi:hypothetical protein
MDEEDEYFAAIIKPREEEKTVLVLIVTGEVLIL